MARPNRIKLDGEGYYHVIDRIALREFLLRDERIKKRLLDLYASHGGRSAQRRVA